MTHLPGVAVLGAALTIAACAGQTGQPVRVTDGVDYAGAVSACDRAGKAIDGLLAWEVQLLSIVTLTDPDHLRGVRLHLAPPATPDEAGGAIELVLINQALSRGRSITIDTDIWLASPVDTRSPWGIRALVHEATHVHQYWRRGKAAFFGAYTAATLRNLGDWRTTLPERQAMLAADAADDLLARHPEITAAIRACRDLPPQVVANRAALTAEYLALLEQRALTGSYGDDVRAQPRSLSAANP